MRYGYAASIGSLVWALTKAASDREGAFDWGQMSDGGHLTGGKWPTFGVAYAPNGIASDYSDRAALLLMSV